MNMPLKYIADRGDEKPSKFTYDLLIDLDQSALTIVRMRPSHWNRSKAKVEASFFKANGILYNICRENPTLIKTPTQSIGE